MNEIITKLNEIEEKADAMLSDAKNQKEQLAAKLERQKQLLDEKYAAMEKEKMKQLKEQLKKAAQEEIAREKKETEQAIIQLAERFEKEKESMAEEIFQRIIAQ